MQFTSRAIGLSIILASALISLPSSAAPGDAALAAKQGFERRLKVKADTVAPAGVAGLMEVVVDNKVYYTDATGRFLIKGDIVDLDTNTNLTSVKFDRINKVDFKALPSNGLIKFVNGNGSRILVTFEDPNCGYCKQLTSQLKALRDVTIVTYPVAILGADSLVKAQSALCAASPEKQWDALLTQADATYGIDAGCKSLALVERNTKLMSALHFGGTPALVFEDGSRLASYATAAQIEPRLQAATAERQKRAGGK